MHISQKIFPDTVTSKYSLHPLTSDDGYVYMQISKGMYGLPHTGCLANDLLCKQLAPHGFLNAHTLPVTGGTNQEAQNSASGLMILV